MVNQLKGKEGTSVTIANPKNWRETTYISLTSLNLHRSHKFRECVCVLFMALRFLELTQICLRQGHSYYSRECSQSKARFEKLHFILQTWLIE